jgi:putative transposase
MGKISFDHPFYFFTSVAHHRLPIFRSDQIKDVMCKALNEARRSSEMLYFAYVLMPDHFHIITDGKRSPSDSLRYLNGISARRIINYLKENDYTSSLLKLRQAKKKDGYQYSVWEHHSDKFLLTSESMLMQKVRYIHNNPVEAGLAKKAEEYRYSSARIWSKVPTENEPLEMDIAKIDWRRE